MYSLANVANLVHGVILASSNREIHPIVHFLEYLKVFLVVNSADVNTNTLSSSFFPRECHENLVEFVLVQGSSVLSCNIYECSE